MDYKLIAIDMDDTLLTHDKKISDENLRALNKAYKEGIYVVISTGRVYASAYAYADMIGFNTFIIASNGALLKGPYNQIIYENILNFNSMKNIIQICNKYKTYFQLITDTTVYSPQLTNKFQRYKEWNKLFKSELKVDVKEIKNPLEDINHIKDDILKMIIFDEDENTLKKIRAEIETDNLIQLTSSYYDNIEVVNKGVSKGRALEILGDYLNIKREEMIAIGDSENDLAMIKYAGLGVAMGNAIDSVKQAADYITKTNMEDGVKHVIDKFIFKTTD